MDDKTLQAMTALANKLGTTAEYLWGVLVKQAPITGAIDLAVMAAWVFAGIWMVRFVRSKTATPEKTEEDPYPSAEWRHEVAGLAWAGAIFISFFAAVIVSCDLSNVVAALANPEYWALKQVLK